MRDYFNMRDYQVKTIERIKSFINEKEKELVINLYTGLGKTFLMPRIADNLSADFNILIMSDVNQLIKQLKEHFKSINIEPVEITAEKDNVELSRITLASEQTLCNRINKVNKIENLIILYDEAHKRRYGERFETIINRLEPVKLIGFTATPYDFWGVKMFKNVYKPISFKEAINNGFLSKMQYYIPSIVKTIDFESIDKKPSADYTAEDIRKLYNTSKFIGWFKYFLETLNLQKRQTLVYTSSIKMAEEYCEIIKSIEPACAVVHSEQNSEINNTIIDDFKNNKIKVLVSVTSLTVGFDAPNVDTIINLRPTKSVPLFHQIVGRGTRIYEGKTHCEFYDITNCIVFHGIPEYFEPYNSKKEIIREPVESLLFRKSDNDIVNINVDIVENYNIEMIKLENENIRNIETNKLNDLFYYETDIYKLILIADELYKRKWMKKYGLTSETISWINDNMVYYLNKLTELAGYNKTKSILKAYKTRMKNIINTGKKLQSMYYFAEWFYFKTIKEYNL